MSPKRDKTWHQPGEHPHYAYPGHPEMEAIMRLSAVKRWHMIETRRTQTLAEHTANVALLGWYIAYRSPDAFFNPAALAIAGLTHDLDEAFTGDLPTPTKSALGKQSLAEFAYSTLPKVFQQDLLPRTALLLKLCDLADGIRFVRSNGVDATSHHARIGLEKQLTTRLAEAKDSWPPEVTLHVLNNLLMYAYEESFETGNFVAPMGIPSAFRVLAHDLARGP